MKSAIRLGLILASLGTLVAVRLVSQNEPLAERFRRMSVEAEKKGLAEPYKGISAKGDLETGLFKIRSTGVSTEAVRDAAEKFLNILTPEQRARTTFPVDDDEWRKWMNQHFYVRQGVSFLEMNEKQREAGFALLRAGLSAKGLKLTRDIMKLNETLGELNGNDFQQYGEFRYYITVMGKPSPTEPWGWQLDGHHAIINYFVLGDQVVMTPFFAGSEPVIAPSGKYKGLSVLQDEQDYGLAMIKGLDEPQRQKAILTFSKIQQKQLVDLIELYVDNMDDGHARVKMDEVRKYLDRTYFAWIGKTEQGSVFYYRIHSPVILIEFDHQLPANYRGAGIDPKVPNPQHVHVVVRTPNGNDYGKDLLRQHYAMHPHGPSGSH